MNECYSHDGQQPCIMEEDKQCQVAGININEIENHLPGSVGPLTDTDWTRFQNTQLHPAEPYPPKSHATERKQYSKDLWVPCRKVCGLSRYQRSASGSGVENRFNVDSRGDRRIGVGYGGKCDQQQPDEEKVV